MDFHQFIMSESALMHWCIDALTYYGVCGSWNSSIATLLHCCIDMFMGGVDHRIPAVLHCSIDALTWIWVVWMIYFQHYRITPLLHYSIIDIFMGGVDHIYFQHYRITPLLHWPEYGPCVDRIKGPRIIQCYVWQHVYRSLCDWLWPCVYVNVAVCMTPNAALLHCMIALVPLPNATMLCT